MYNFFADSPAVEQQWRVVLRDVPDEKAPRLDVTKHCPSMRIASHA